ncbi:hypothetical protein TCA2_4534 [Paenibacillus sp. TCA20]|uniref:DUF2479 domain-containing protein n=1 Tax=Paenibacillus urinalis TaxID=521520 RepID=A0ABY7XH74_9BACL|nr:MULTISPECIES: hypothetical protein [Paenibacillus]WDI05133.1 hypothetical protein PUW25_25330 [Paenibacillus urinalis]GAK42042.1 hypothetical protein TCA2_4534 [Paenibacillus sp. TCA20]
MAITRFRGEQIRDAVLKNSHIADDAAIAESKLAVNWEEHYQTALEGKKVADYIQVIATDVSGVANLDVSEIIPATVPNVLSDPLSGEGVIVDAPKNKVILRDVVTGEPVLDDKDQEVFGRMTFEGGVFVLKFYSPDGAGEVPFTMPEGQKIDWQYLKRFNLQTVSEMFAANEKFAEGTADATAHLNINQLAQDLYGAGFSLDRDGNGNLPKAIVQQIADEIQARIAADQAIRTDFASNEAGKGASTIGVQDEAGHFAGATVEAVLAEIFEALTGISNGGTTTQVEVDAARVSTLTGEHEALNDRLEADAAALAKQVADEKERAEAAEEALAGRATDLETEVTAARGTAETIDARLDRALNEDGTLKAGKDIHRHPKAVYVANGGESVVQLADFNVEDLPPYQVGDMTLDVYINGGLQHEGLNYAEVAGGLSINFDVGDGTTLITGDLVTIKYQVNNVE